MNNIDFDRKIKEMMDSYQEPVGEDLWPEVEKGLRRRETLFWVKGVTAVAVAASLVVGLILDFGHTDTIYSSQLAYSIDIPRFKGDIEEDGPHSVKRLYVVERPAPQMAIASQVAPQTEMEQIVPSVSEVSENVEVLSQQNMGEEDVKAVEEVSQSYDWDLLAENDTYVEKRGVVLDLSSNVLALGGGSNVYSGTSYMPGVSMDVKNGIVPISKPTYSLPLSLGLNLQIPFTERFSIGTGLKYTYLHSSFQALVDNSAQALVDQKMHYIGIPVSLFYEVLSQKNLSCYVTGGGVMEKGLGLASEIKDIKDGISHRKEKIEGLQWSVNVGVGLQYFFTDFFGLYFDPSLVYFFDCDQPFSIRTSQPLQFEMELGLRFKL